MPYALVHYHELALKGRNRGFFEQRLIQHLRNSLKKTGRHRSQIAVRSYPGHLHERVVLGRRSGSHSSYFRGGELFLGLFPADRLRNAGYHAALQSH